MQNKYTHRGLALFLSLLSLSLGLLNLHDGQTWSNEDGGNGDFAQYLLQALALLQRDIDNFIQASRFMTFNSYDGLGPIIYPWGYPILLALGIKTFGVDILALKYINLILFASFAGSFYLICKKTLPNKLAFLGALLFALSPYFLHFHNRLLSDVPFMFIAFLAAFIMQKYFTPPPPPRILSSIALGIIFIIAFLIRSNGIILPLSFAFVIFIFFIYKLIPHHISKNLMKHYALPPIWAQITPLGIFVCGYIYINQYLPNGGAGHPHMLLQTLHIKSILGNVFYYFNIFQDFFPLLKGFALVIAMPFLLYGIYKYFYKHFVLLIFCMGIYMLNIIWPFTQGLRFVFVLLPFCVYWTLLGFYHCSLSPHIRYLCKASFIALLVIFCYYDIKEIYQNYQQKRHLDMHVYSDNALEIYDFIQTHTQPDEIILFFQPKILYLNTRHLSLYPTKDCIKQANCVLPFMHNASYLLLSKEDDDSFIWLLWQTYLQKVYENTKLIMYKIHGLQHLDL